MTTPSEATSARRQLLPFAALSASYFAHIGFFNPYLPLWLKALGLDLFTISVLTSLQAFTRLFAPYGWGWLSDHTGERVKLLRYSATVALVAACGLWLQGGTTVLMVVLLIMFTHTSSMMPMSEAAMAHLVSQNGIFNARRYGRVRLFGSVGFLVTVGAAGAWFEHHGMRDFPAWTVLTMLAVTVSVWCLPDLKEAVPTGLEKVAMLPILRQKAVRWFLASAFFHVLAHVAIYVFFSLYLDALGYAKSTIGLLWAVSVVVEIAWFFTQARWLPLMSLPAWLVLCAGAMVLRMGITATGAAWIGWLVAAQLLHALTFATHHTACIALLSHYFPGRLRGRGQALYVVVAYGLPGVLGGVAGGALSVRLGLGAVYWAAVVASVLATACAITVWRLRDDAPLPPLPLPPLPLAASPGTPPLA